MESTEELEKAISDAVADGDLAEVERLREVWLTADAMERVSGG